MANYRNSIGSNSTGPGTGIGGNGGGGGGGGPQSPNSPMSPHSYSPSPQSPAGCSQTSPGALSQTSPFSPGAAGENFFMQQQQQQLQHQFEQFNMVSSSRSLLSLRVCMYFVLCSPSFCLELVVTVSPDIKRISLES